MQAVNFAQEEEKRKKSTLKGYAPTPYRDSEWEVLSASVDMGFMPLDLEVVSTIADFEDPLFESFDQKNKTKTSSRKNNTLPEEEKQVIDPALLDQSQSLYQLLQCREVYAVLP